VQHDSSELRVTGQRDRVRLLRQRIYRARERGELDRCALFQVRDLGRIRHEAAPDVHQLARAVVALHPDAEIAGHRLLEPARRGHARELLAVNVVEGEAVDGRVAQYDDQQPDRAG